jgi:hypothetical protein
MKECNHKWFSPQRRMEKLKESLTCSICMEVATLPVHAMCCENTKSLPPACFNCVYTYLQLNQPQTERPCRKMSWSGCGCYINVRQKSNLIFSHTVQLDTIRNLIGPSFCPHEECKAKFSTTAELRRHINGTSREKAREFNCQYVMTRCKYCDFYDVRHVVEGSHYEEKHNTVYCPICNQYLKLKCAKEHYNRHVQFMKTLHRNLMHKKVVDENDTPPPELLEIKND